MHHARDRGYGGAQPFAPNPAFPNCPALSFSEEERCLMMRHAALAHRLGITRKIDIWEEEAESTFGISDLWQAAREGNLGRLKYILEHGGSVSSQRWSGVQAIHRAAEEGRTEAVALLVEYGADVNARTTWGWFVIFDFSFLLLCIVHHFISTGTHHYISLVHEGIQKLAWLS